MFLAFAGKSDYHIGADSCIGDIFCYPLDYLYILAGKIPPPHLFENFITAALQRNMKVMTDYFAVSDKPDEFFSNTVWLN